MYTEEPRFLFCEECQSGSNRTRLAEYRRRILRCAYEFEATKRDFPRGVRSSSMLKRGVCPK